MTFRLQATLLGEARTLGAALNEATLDERELMSAIRRGDKRAYSSLYDSHVRPVFAFALSRVRDRTLADDVVQATFVLLWEKRATLEIAAASVLPWLLGVARLQCMAAIKKAARSQSLESRGEIADNSTPERAAEAAELTATVRRAVEALPPIDRKIVELCLDQDTTYAEAARRLGLTEPGVRGRLARARQRLRAELNFLRGGES